MHCFKFLKGTCIAGDDCAFAHMDEKTVKELQRVQKARAAKAKAKAAPKAKAGAAPGAAPAAQ